MRRAWQRAFIGAAVSGDVSIMGAERRTGLFVAGAFLAAVILAAAVLAGFGGGQHGLVLALQATARLAFVYYWLAYVGGPLVALFGSAFRPLAKRGRDLGLAFAAVEVVHLSLVARLCVIGYAPGRAVFILFGTAAFFVFLLALFSFAPPRRLLHPALWQALRFVGMNFIAYAFFVDLKLGAFSGSIMHRLYYLPFLACLILAVMCRAAALLLPLRGWAARQWRRFPSRPA